MQSCELVEGTRWHKDFPAVVDVLAFGAGQHDHGVAAVVFIEAERSAAGHAAHHGWRIHAVHHVVVVVEELGAKLWIVSEWAIIYTGRVVLTMMGWSRSL